MFTLSSDLRFHLYNQPTDMRKSFNSLSGKGEMKWRGTDDSGNPVPKGTYILAIILNGKEREAMKVMRK